MVHGYLNDVAVNGVVVQVNDGSVFESAYFKNTWGRGGKKAFLFFLSEAP